MRYSYTCELNEEKKRELALMGLGAAIGVAYSIGQSIGNGGSNLGIGTGFGFGGGGLLGQRVLAEYLF